MSLVIKIVQCPDVLDSIRASTQFHREIEGLVEAGIKLFLIDLKNVTFISSSGLLALVVAFRLVRSAGGKLFICSMNEQVKMLFELTGVDQVFESFATLDEFNNTVLKRGERRQMDGDSDPTELKTTGREGEVGDLNPCVADGRSYDLDIEVEGSFLSPVSLSPG